MNLHNLAPASLPTPAAALAAMTWDEVASLLAFATPIIAVPLGVITFYLRSLREQQTSAREALTRRCEQVESDLDRLERRVLENERDFATKEDWLRESMHARRSLEHLSQACARLEGRAEQPARVHPPNTPTPDLQHEELPSIHGREPKP